MPTVISFFCISKSAPPNKLASKDTAEPVAIAVALPTGNLYVPVLIRFLISFISALICFLAALFKVTSFNLFSKKRVPNFLVTAFVANAPNPALSKFVGSTAPFHKLEKIPPAQPLPPVS